MMPLIALSGGKPLHERTPGEIFWLFGVLPILFGGGLLILASVQVAWSAESLTWEDWLGAVWAVVMAAVLMIGLPGTGWRELQRRKQFREAQEKKAAHAHHRGDPS